MISLCPWPNQFTSAVLPATGRLLMFEANCGLVTLTMTVSNAARLAAVTLAGARFVMLMPVRSVPLVGRNPPVPTVPLPIIATFTELVNDSITRFSKGSIAWLARVNRAAARRRAANPRRRGVWRDALRLDAIDVNGV